MQFADIGWDDVHLDHISKDFSFQDLRSQKLNRRPSTIARAMCATAVTESRTFA